MFITTEVEVSLNGSSPESNSPVASLTSITNSSSALSRSVQAPQPSSGSHNVSRGVSPIVSKYPKEESQGSVFHARSQDVDEQATWLRDWNQSYAQIAAGGFAGNISKADFGDVSLFIEYTSHTLFQTGELPPGVAAIGVPLNMAGAAIFCGSSSVGSSVPIFSGKDGFEFYSPGELLMGGIVVPLRPLLETLGEEEQELASRNLEFAHLFKPRDEMLSSAKDFIQGVFGMTKDCPHMLRNAPLMEVLRKSVLSNISQLLIDHCTVQESLPPPLKRWKMVTLAREFVQSRPEIPTDVAVLCKSLGVSRRTLQYCFQDVLNISPLAFLRAIRLNGVRRMLRTASSVTEAAAHWGFWHFGYFARDYRNMFGELPSETHRRVRQPLKLQAESDTILGRSETGT